MADWQIALLPIGKSRGKREYAAIRSGLERASYDCRHTLRYKQFFIIKIDNITTSNYIESIYNYLYTLYALP